MSQTVPVALSDGTKFRIEARSEGGYQDAGVLEALSFEAVTSTIVSLGNALSSALDALTPDKATIEFGMEVGVESGKLTALVCQGNTKANFTIKLEWER